MLIVRYRIYPRRQIVGPITVELLLWLSLCVCLSLWLAVAVATMLPSYWAYNWDWEWEKRIYLLGFFGGSAVLALIYLLLAVVTGLVLYTRRRA